MIATPSAAALASPCGPTTPMVTGPAYSNLVSLRQLVVHIGRSASPMCLPEHRHLVQVRVVWISAERVLPDQVAP